MNEQTKNKLLQYEAAPPAKTWDTIAAALEEDRNQPFARKLHDFESEPDARCWQKIEEQLNAGVNGNTATKVVPLYHRYSKPIKYVSAAAILMVVAVSVSLLFITKDPTEIAAHTSISTKDMNADSTPFAASGQKSMDNRTVQQVRDKKQQGSEKRYTNNDVESITEGKLYSNRYVAITNDKGRTVKLSKKVVPVFNCADNATAYNNSRCKENIKSLQQKMATSAISPTTDFAGLLDMIKSLEENE